MDTDIRMLLKAERENWKKAYGKRNKRDIYSYLSWLDF